MRLTIDHSTLAKAVGRAASIAPARTTIPIVQHILMRVADGKLSLTSTNLDMWLTSTIDLSDLAAEEGEVCVDARILNDIVRAAPVGAELSIVWKHGEGDGRAQVAFGRSRYQLPVLHARDFPEAFGGTGVIFETGVSMTARDLARLFNDVDFAQSDNDTLHHLCGSFLHSVPADDVTGERIRAVATNGHVMAYSDFPMPEGGQLSRGVIVPSATVSEIVKILETQQPDALVSLQTAPTAIRLTTDRDELTSKVIDGSFPDYGRIIPGQSDRFFVADRAVLASAVRRTALMSRERTKGLKLEVEPGHLRLSCRNMEAGDADETMEIAYEGDPFVIGFNAAYLLHVLGQGDSEQVRIDGSEAAKPYRFEAPLGSKDVLSIVTPMVV